MRCSILDMVRRNNYRILKLLLKLPTGFKKRDLDVALVHAVKAGFFECAKVAYYLYFLYFIILSLYYTAVTLSLTRPVK